MATICTNCGNNAAHTITDLGGNHTHYCVECLPSWLRKRATAGEFKLVSAVKEVADTIEETIKEVEAKVTSKKKKAVVEESATPVEEASAPAEEAPADENN